MIASGFYGGGKENGDVPVTNGNSAGSEESHNSDHGGSGSNGAYEDDFPELTVAKFSNLRLDNSPPNVPSVSGGYGF